MNTLMTAGEALLLAQVGQQQIAAALAIEARRLARNLLSWLGHSPVGGRPK